MKYAQVSAYKFVQNAPIKTKLLVRISVVSTTQIKKDKELFYMYKKIISAMIALTMVMGMCSCSENALTGSAKDPASSVSSPSGDPVIKTEPEEPEPTYGGEVVELTANKTFKAASADAKNDERFISGLSSFSVELFKRTVKNDLTADGKNTLVSPESVAFALGMVQNGANGNTLKQMQDVLCKGVDQDTFNRNMNLLITKANNNNTDKSKLSIANSVWVKDRSDLTLTEQFASSCKELYNAEMFKAAFDMTTVEKLNSWVNEKTDNMIPKIIDKFSPDEIICLVNCVAFDSEWEEQYKETQIMQGQKFTNAKGEQVDCTMLSGTENTYIENGRATGFVKAYKGGKYAFMAVLPNEDTGIANYVGSMPDDEIAKLYSARQQDCEVITKLPQFKFDYGAELAETLSDMGIKDAFSQNADFSKLFNNTSAAINRVIHKTHIELDAKGTKAAAATAVTMTENAIAVREEPKSVILDRPFVFAIIDTQTGLPVFMGTVCDPSAE